MDALKSRSKFHLSDDHFPVGHYQLDAFRDEASAVLTDIPSGALILTVRENRSYVPIVVTHIGFVVPSPTQSARCFVTPPNGLSASGTQ